MELTTRGRYAVMAMADIARHSRDMPVALSSVAERQQLSLAYLEQLIARLRRVGLLESARGRTGGYRLGKPADQVSIAEILIAVEEGTRMTRCSSGRGCVGENRCITHHLWDALGAHIGSFFESVSLSDVIEGRPLFGSTRNMAPTIEAAAE
ncbi:MAG: Rrf2 family transcriptional regulator [Hyphomicrobium sp.]|nr:Rrf2 family transcriptional regulator [Hyphomicrobium sp.]